MAVTVRELEKIRREGLKALKDKLGVEGMINSYRCIVMEKETIQRKSMKIQKN